MAVTDRRLKAGTGTAYATLIFPFDPTTGLEDVI